MALTALLAELLPGGAGFPPAAGLGLEPIVLARLRAAGTDVPPGATAADLERDDPAAFATLRRLAYLTYYEQPAVLAAIRALGHPYNDSPLPGGYPAEPFDPVRDVPAIRRGRWIPTDAVRRVDLSPEATKR